MKRWLPYITGLVLVAGIAWSFAYMRALHPFGRAVTDLGDEHLQDVGLVFEGATLVGWSERQRIWKIQAKTVEVSRDRRRATFRHVTAGSLIKAREPIATMKAGKVVYNTITRNAFVPGAAALAVKDGPSFKTNSIYWKASASRLACGGGVSATFGGSTFHGEKMVADLAKKELTISKVYGTIRLPD